MIRHAAPDRFSWTISIVLHLELILIAAVAFDGEEVEYRFSPDPDFHCALVPRGPLLRVEPVFDRFGRWPMSCDHRSLLRAARMSSDRIGAEERCKVCGWPWWVIRAASED